MAEHRENQRELSSCSEDALFAEMTKTVNEKQGDGCTLSCAGIMREMIVLDDYQVWFFAQVFAPHRAQMG
jgi:hypothetical protein